jgi:hypothetical protein
VAALDSDLTLAATLAGELGVDAADSRLPRLIAAASDACRQHMGRSRVHYSSAYTENVAGFGRRRLVLELTPLITITSVTGPDGTTVPSTEYSIDDPEAGLLLRDVLWPNTALVRGGLLYKDLDPGTEKKSIAVVYVGGWVTPAQFASGGWPGPARSLPYDVEQAAIVVATAMYRGGGADPRVQSESLGDYSVTYWQGGAGIPEQAQALLGPYTRLR